MSINTPDPECLKHMENLLIKGIQGEMINILNQINMQTRKVFTDSSQVREIFYVESSNRMEVLFVVGKRYAYYDVPVSVWKEAISAESIGKFINSEIKRKYKFELI